ncbi:sugar phosphate nucleotidyltransferase [Paraglaciecola hydrolytica]|uniref:Glucose-1-phosphate cytidylyltransferase n=1 Tax=Paraglaciecola hydrolytica TaxID=1799789 RepID=A0A135ZZA6_9ALTE|nr:sugar phosphate nucleotidyltransferase [Paraglaciecola hydrolytica]KXI28311.1 glucose-1-phosphate cytidylyltransferase [Paraglaciecola hydrolytica]
MKVVFFCGGLGTRLREYTETLPKSLVPIGEQPILWHLMQYYAHYGHNEFILCLGYKGDLIKQFFINQIATAQHPVNSSVEDNTLHLINEDGSDWHITFVDTGPEANIGERLRMIRPYLVADEVFMANYSDGLSDLPLNEYVAHFTQQDKIASFACVRPNSSFHTVELSQEGLVQDIRPAHQSEFWINGGFFIFKTGIFDYLHEGEELVEEPFKRLIDAQQLVAYPHQGFWACMDTLKDKISFDQWVEQQEKRWRVWLN